MTQKTSTEYENVDESATKTAPDPLSRSSPNTDILAEGKDKVQPAGDLPNFHSIESNGINPSQLSSAALYQQSSTPSVSTDRPFSDLEVNTQVSALSPTMPTSDKAATTVVPDSAQPPEVPLASGLEVSDQSPTVTLDNDPKAQAADAPATGPGVTPLHMLHKDPKYIDCPFCKTRSLTRVNKVGTSMQTMAGVVLCLLCFCITCLPCIMGWFENIEHYCTKCGQLVARLPHDGPIEVFSPETHPTQVPSKYSENGKRAP